LRFLVDMPLSPMLADWLNRQGHEAVHALQVGLDRSSDDAILARASAEGQVIVTADLDYPRLLALAGAKGPGLILFRGGNYSEAESIGRLSAALDRIAERELPHSIVVIEKRRIRQRHLPI